MFGSVIAWFYKTLAGINYDPLNPGMKNFIIAPDLTSGLTFCRASYNSVYGEIVSDWTNENKLLTLNVQIPPNTTADLFLPAIEKEKITEGGNSLAHVKEIESVKIQSGKTILHLSSGKYHFQIRN